jgi:hypothetical protein
MRRFKVWTIDPDGEPGTLLLRTNSADEHVGAYDITFISSEDPTEVARVACERTGHVGWVLVKYFDTWEESAWTVVGVSVENEP